MRILHSKKLIFISNPRCGSTSIRLFIDSIMLPGDEKCDHGNQYPEMPILHPHMSAPAVAHYLNSKGIDIGEYQVFTITRNPIDMLWSYYNYFKPDINSNYNYSPKYKSAQLADFEYWLEHGQVGIGLWRKYCPDYITDTNFTPLSLEAHANNNKNNNLINKVFKLEELSDCRIWLEEYLGMNVDIGSHNGSKSTQIPVVSPDTLRKLKQNFKLESSLYNL